MTATAAPAPHPHQLSMQQVLICGAAVVMLSMGIRHGFGLWLQPITMERGWSRETFAFAMAIQNIAWGLAGPIVGMFADRYGAFRALLFGAVCYAGGLLGMALADTGTLFALSTGVLIGIAQAGTTYAVIYGVVARNTSDEKRSMAMGMVAAAGSFGQFLMLWVENWLIGSTGWQNALFVLCCASLLIIPLALGLKEGPRAAPAGPQQTMGAALREAFSYPSFRWLTAGYFVCGFQVVFIGVHMPSYLKDNGMSPQVATTALALVGLFNVFGTYAAGVMGQRLAKRHILAGIYALRGLVITLFILAPLTPWSVYIFACAMGLLWLSTVPPTNALVAQIFGVQYMSMLGGVVFLNHQLGSFLGAWLGGKIYDLTGSYNLMWWLLVATSVLGTLANLPVRETPIVRAAPQPA